MRNATHYATPDRTVKELYQATLSKRMALLRAGYTVIECWSVNGTNWWTPMKQSNVS